MGNEQILFIFLLSIVAVSLEVIRRSVLEVLRSGKQKELAKLTRRLRWPVQPWVTVLLYTHNQSVETEKTVRSLLKSRYHNYDVVVVSDRSTDDTAARMSSLIGGSSLLRLRLLRRRAKGAKKDAIRAAYRKSQKGELIICLSPGVVVDPMFIKRAVAGQGGRKKWRVRLPHATNSGVGIYSVINRLRGAFTGNETTVSAFSKKCFLSKSTKLDQKDTSATAFYAAPFVVLAILLVLSAVGGSLLVLWYGWIVFTLYLLALIWLQIETPVKDRLALTFSVPPALFLLSAASLVEHFFGHFTRK